MPTALDYVRKVIEKADPNHKAKWCVHIMYYSLYASWANDQLITGGKTIKKVNIKIRKQQKKEHHFFHQNLTNFIT